MTLLTAIFSATTIDLFWTPGYPEGSHEIGLSVLRLSVLPSFCPSFSPGVFFGIVSFAFSKFQHGARNPYEVVRDRARFSRKVFSASKIGKMYQKWAKNKIFEFIEKFCN